MITTNNTSSHPSLGATATGTALGCTSYLGIKVIDRLTRKVASDKIKNLDKDNNPEILKKNLSDAIEISGLKKHNVKIKDYSSAAHADFASYKQTLRAKLQTQLKDKDFFQRIKQRMLYSKKCKWVRLQVACNNGENACFSKKQNLVHLNIKKRGLAGFHELGHAINYNQSAIWSKIQKTKIISIVAIPALTLIAIFKRGKNENEKPKNFVDSTTTFIKNNAGKLAFLSMVPVILEELKATQNGNKLAKSICSPELYKKVVKSNKFAALTYINCALATGIGLWAIGKVKDSVANASVKK